MSLTPLVNPDGHVVSSAHRRDHARRMNRVINFIDAHLADSLDLEELAAVANFSSFHFHRVFAAWMGETLGDYIRRRRLEKAAFRLSCGERETILHTALACGFGSGEAFARAFKLKFGYTPSAWREKGGQRGMPGPCPPSQAYSNLDQDRRKPGHTEGGGWPHHEFLQQPEESESMKVSIVTLPAVRVAYHRRMGVYGSGVSRFWSDTVLPWMQSNGLADAKCYGVAYDDPTLTPPGKCRYDACVELPLDHSTIGRADVMDLPGGRYALAQFKGEPLSIGDAWTRLLRDWLPSSGFQCDDRPSFEMFAVSTALDPRTGEFSCDICIPVRSL